MNLIIHTFILINFALVYGASPSDLCPKFNDASPGYLPDEDCGRFYQCSNGIAYRFDCPAGLHFNVKLNVCDWPANAGCEQRKTTKKPTTELTTTKGSSTEIETATTTEVPRTTTVSTKETTLSTTTTATTIHETTLSTEAAASTEVPRTTTISTEETTLSTTIATTPVPTHETTLSAEVASLSTDETTLSTVETTTPSEPSAETTINGTTKVPNNQRTNDNTLETTTAMLDICSQQANKSFLAPDSNDCAKYLYCNYGTVQIMNCPNGRYFNPVMLICTLPSQAECYI